VSVADRRGQARDLMARFAERTGLTSGRAPRRYLWTDAFAVCNFLALGDHELALRLVEQTHRVLGRHRPDDARRGWLSGLADAAGEAHPTAGGLRIGKPLPERGPAEPFDDRLEWDRDGQYFHYLTKWMHALDQVARATGRAMFRDWARELAAAAHRGFVHGTRMYWKMSVDLSRPLVPSMGHHDPLDGFVTCLQLGLPELAADFAAMLDPAGLATDDPLGLGGLLGDAFRLAQLGVHPEVQDALLGAARAGLRGFAGQPLLHLPAGHRLAFRELGLAIGLAAPLPGLERHAPLRDAIDAFWADPSHRQVAAWREHADINDVMLATSLLPEGYLVLGPSPP
jgi:hypothetical protein